ncbi:MAG: metallophosphoesterase family protein [Candidatus Omnitrophica bacterium]|nr:metallophosphoesterase family protein [Candidatus Omnitrophota bacterium]
MRCAVLSDIHGNLEALTAAITACASQGVEQYLCLGDVVGYGADPVACLARLEALKAVAVAGNHEAGCIGKLELNWFTHSARAAIEWTRDQLGFTELDALRRLHWIETEEPFTLVHASLRHPERFAYLTDVGQMIDTLHLCKTLICLAGHTHVPCIVEYDLAQRRLLRVLTAAAELADVSYADEAATRRYFVNPGSVGQPRDGDPRAGFAIIDTSQHRISMHRVAYDIASAQQKIRQAGLPSFLADRLALGR